MHHRSHLNKKHLFVGIILIVLLSLIVYKCWDSSESDETFVYRRAKLRRGVNRTQYPKEAFIVVINSRSNYVQLLEVLLDSVHLFSKRPIIVFSIDFDLKINHSRHFRVIVERISQNSSTCSPYCDGIHLIFHGQKESSISRTIVSTWS